MVFAVGLVVFLVVVVVVGGGGGGGDGGGVPVVAVPVWVVIDEPVEHPVRG
jgi:hypothetical protein